MKSLASILGGIAFVAVLLLVNGGYVYKTTCPLASGSNQVTWSYGINDLVPYIRSTDPPCRSHTTTRLALSVIGIWPLGHGTTQASPTAADHAAADSLQTATAAITAEYARERTHSAALRQEANTDGVTPVVRQKFVSYLNEGETALQSIKVELDRTGTEASDPQLVESRNALSAYLGYQVAADRLFFSSSSVNDWGKQVAAQYGSKLTSVLARLRYLSIAVQGRYPQVKEWGFLPAK